MSLALKKATKPILWKQPRKLVPILFPKYGCFYSIRFVSFGVLRHIENAWGSPSIPHNMGKCNKIHHTGRAWDIITHTFPEIWVVLLYQISILWYVSSYENSNFSNQFLIAWENAAKPIPWERTGT